MLNDNINFVVVGNIAYDVNTFPKRKDNQDEVVINNGGACLYSAIPGSLFSKVGIVSRIGNDFDMNVLNKYNVDLIGLKLIIDAKTMKFYHTYLSKDGQQRTFTKEVDERVLIRVEDIPNQYLNSKYIHVAINFPDTQLEIIKYLKSNSKAIISVDTHEAYVNDDLVKEVFNLADIAFIDKEFINLLDCNSPIKIIKQGKDGCKYISKEKEFLVKPELCNNVIDKTGAGDTVTGVFMSLLSIGKTEEEALEKAVEVATESIKDYGVEHLSSKSLQLTKYK
jgi:sugar/nucleoside kinase (ribokinase family)